jgi:hypothetical protein
MMQISAFPRLGAAAYWPVRPPAEHAMQDLSLLRTPDVAILPDNHSESGECRFNPPLPVWRVEW